MIFWIIIMILMIVWAKNSHQKEKERLIREAREKQQRESQRCIEEHNLRMESDPIYRENYNRALEKVRRIEIENKLRRDAEIRRREEEKKQYEIKRKSELKLKYQYITLGEFRAAYRFLYYPKNRYPFIASSDESNRRAIWNFKDGYYNIGLNIAIEFLEGNFSNEEIRNITFCVIPASSQYKNDIRYKTMCEKLTEKLNVINGYNYISIIHDRTDSRQQKNLNTIENLNISSLVYGKDIILFDDITTRGTSFIQLAQLLKNKGARSVYGLFIGKTVN